MLCNNCTISRLVLGLRIGASLIKPEHGRSTKVELAKAHQVARRYPYAFYLVSCRYSSIRGITLV